MKKVKNKLRVLHYPQIGSLKKCFIVYVKDEEEAYKIMDTLADQHLWLLKHKVIPDYSNIMFVEMFDESINEETGKPYGWGEYWNEEESMEWDTFEQEYLENNTAINECN